MVLPYLPKCFFDLPSFFVYFVFVVVFILTCLLRETGSNKPSVLCSDGLCFEKMCLSEENLMPPCQKWDI